MFYLLKPLVVIDLTYMVYPETVINFSKLQRTHTNLLTTKRDSQEDSRALLESNGVEEDQVQVSVNEH